jgi:beta-glucosidase
MARQYQNIIDRMSLEEKCGLLSGGSAFDTRSYTKLGIPKLTFSDGPHGLRKQEAGANHLGLGGSVRATCFPTAASIANSWDPELGEIIGRALGAEAAAQQVNVVLGPGLNIKRNPLCGRNFEYFSEDPYLAGKMAAGYVRGIQANGLAACPKHFAVNSQELCRMSNDSEVDERTLREIYLTGFEIAVKEGGTKVIMTSYNRVNGEFANENEHLLKDILRGEWGYKGAVVTDWGGSNDHVKGVNCGSNFEMPSPGFDPIYELLKGVKDGRISEETINDRVEEALELILPTDEVIRASAKSFDEDAHHRVAEMAAFESIVLLKNEEKILPLATGTKVAVVGDFAEHPRYQGAGSSLVNPTRLETILEKIEDSGLDCIGYAKGYDRNGATDAKLCAEAVELAKKADIVLYVFGLDEMKESEGLDRANMRINENQVEVMRAIAGVNEKLIGILCAGSSVEMPWLDCLKGLVYASLGGQAGAKSVLDVITGRYNPCGKLSESYAMRYEDNPSHANYPAEGRTSEYREGIYVGYRYYEKTGTPVRFPFGFGLSYTSYEYSDLEIDDRGVSLTVTNTGDREGAEVIQLYIGKKDSALFRPVKELKGFARVVLEPGEAKKVRIDFDDKSFRVYDVAGSRWAVEGGEYDIYVGASSQDIRLQGQIAVEGEKLTDPYAGAPEVECYRTGQVQNVPDAAFAAVLGRKIPDQKIVIDRNITFNQLCHGRSPLFWLIWAVMTVIKKRADKAGRPNLNLLFTYNMPLRALQKMTGGFFSMGMVDALVMEVKGFWVIGIVRFVIELVINLAKSARMGAILSKNA